MDNASKSSILSSAGLLGGLYYAFSKNKSFLGYVGFGFLGSLVGYTIGKILFPTPLVVTTTPPTETTDSEKKS